MQPTAEQPSSCNCLLARSQGVAEVDKMAFCRSRRLFGVLNRNAAAEYSVSGGV